MSAGVAVAGGEDELLGAGGADAVDGGLVVGEDKGRWHVVGFVHYSENYIGVVEEAGGEFLPEGLEVVSRRGVGVAGVANNAAGRGLLGWVVVTHVIVGVEDGIGALCEGDVVDSIFVEGEVLGLHE